MRANSLRKCLQTALRKSVQTALRKCVQIVLRKCVQTALRKCSHERPPALTFVHRGALDGVVVWVRPSGAQAGLTPLAVVGLSARFDAEDLLEKRVRLLAF
jgi:hypothetical protein